MNEKRLRVYLHSLEPDLPPLLQEMEAYAEEHHVPIARKETASFLETITAAKQPSRILEVGTAIGYTSLRLSRVMPEDARIVTIERNETRLRLAREFIGRAGEDRITVMAGDASEILSDLEGPFDMIFLDAAKGQYPAFLPELMKLLPKGGLLITDNVLQEGTLLESRYSVSRRDRTIHQRMRDYLYEIKHSEMFTTSVLPLGDGVALSVRR